MRMVKRSMQSEIGAIKPRRVIKNNVKTTIMMKTATIKSMSTIKVITK